jgi:acetylornithine deacetylase/succinyl-diaminopimelate desuccinylase-like protein
MLAQSLKDSIERVTGREATFSGYTGGTDMTYLMAAGVLTIIFGRAIWHTLIRLRSSFR